MLTCPYCSDEVRPDPKNPGKYLCYNCKKRFQADQVVNVPDGNDYLYDEEDDMGYQGMAAQAPYSSYPSGQGMPAYPQGGPQQPQKLPKGKAIASIIFGILSMLTCVILPVAVVFGLIALILGIIAVRKAKKGLGGGKGLGIGGIITGILGIILGALVGGLMLMTVLYMAGEVENGNIVINENNNTVEFHGDAANLANEANLNSNENIIIEGQNQNDNANDNANANAANANSAGSNAAQQSGNSNANASSSGSSAAPALDKGAIAGSLYDNGGFAVTFDGKDKYVVEPDPKGYNVMIARDAGSPTALYLSVDSIAAASEDAYLQSRQGLNGGTIQTINIAGRDVPTVGYQDQNGYNLAFCKIVDGNQLSVDITAPSEADAKAIASFFTRF